MATSPHVEDVVTVLIVVTGPPASGKSTWVRQHARSGDITVDFDALANTFAGADRDNHDHSGAVVAVTKAARQAAIMAAMQHTQAVDVYLIHSTPGLRTLQRYRADGAQVVTIDPGYDTVMARCRTQRPPSMIEAAERWYREHGYQQGENVAPTSLSRAW